MYKQRLAEEGKQHHRLHNAERIQGYTQKPKQADVKKSLVQYRLTHQ